jgi:hypothetical protein
LLTPEASIGPPGLLTPEASSGPPGLLGARHGCRPRARVEAPVRQVVDRRVGSVLSEVEDPCPVIRRHSLGDRAVSDREDRVAENLYGRGGVAVHPGLARDLAIAPRTPCLTPAPLTRAKPSRAARYEHWRPDLRRPECAKRRGAPRSDQQPNEPELPAN